MAWSPSMPDSAMEALRQTLFRKGQAAQTAHRQKNGLDLAIVGNEEMNEQEGMADNNL